MHQQRRRMETAARDKDGRIFPVEVGITHTEIDGNPIMIGDIQNISDRIAARAERQRLTQLLQDAIGSMTEGFAISDPQDRIQFCNAAFADPYGVPADTLIGRSMTDNIRAYFQNLRRFDGRLVEDAPEQIEWIVERLSSIDGSDIEMELKSGEWRQIRLHRTSDGGSVAIRTDISERKRSEQALLESERMVRRVLDASPIPVGMTYLDDGRIIYESPASRRLFMRHPLPEPVSARTFFADARDRDRYLERLKRDGAVDDFETRMKRTDGTEFPVTISARVVEYQGEQVIVSSTYDLTEVRRIEAEMARQQEALHQAEKLSAVGELLAGVSHELNNPLSVLVGQALLLKETASAPDVAARARRIGDAADRCARIVKTFLAMARQEPGDMIMLQVDEILTAVLEVVGYSLRAAGVEILTEVDPDLPAVVGDPSQLQQVITNLIVNAQHAMQETPPPNRLRLRAWWDAARDHVVLSVQDTGTGVPAHVATRIFEPFFTTKPVGDGTGIGLAIVLRIIESHGGSIVHESPAEGGSRFVVRLPAATERNATSQEPAQETREGTLRILVVDDVPFVAEIFREALTSDGHRVDVETSGQGALARLARQHYDAILCDVRMPHVDGPTLFKRLKEQNPAQAQVLAFITGDAMDRDTRRFLEGSGQPFLDKPVRPADLRNLVLQLAERQR
jgi:PAS domain S-box-containing protein